MLRKLRKWYLCWRYGICPVHGVLRPHGGYAEGKWGICQTCLAENRGKNEMRNTRYERARDEMLRQAAKEAKP